MNRDKQVHRWINGFIDLLFASAITGVLYVFIQVFLIASFKISSDSMSPELVRGDFLWVLKPTIGSRLFNIFESMKGKQVDIYRCPGFKNIRRNDVLVFNYPYSEWDKWSKIEMHILKYYIKRCIALPGDTLSIRDGLYEIEHRNMLAGNIESQKKIVTFNLENLPGEQFYTLPYDSVLRWNIKDFGPMYIPRQGDTISMDRTNYLLYKRLIEWEQRDTLIWRNNEVLLRNLPLKVYRFENDYYFMGGDNSMSSVDSRFWGLVPEEYIVGKAWIVWKSINPDTNKMRWNRFLKLIH